VAPLAGWEGSSFLRIYRVLSRTSRAGPEELAEAGRGGLTPAQLKLYTEYGDDERIRELALSIASSSPKAGDYERVLSLQEHLKNNYLYSLRPGLAEDGDQLARFLFSSRKGYCSYFAFSLALLARSLGIPARVAVGFLVDPEAEVLNFYEVRAFQAHAWVEVFFRGYGWIEFDPSSERIAPGEEYLLAFGFERNRLAKLIAEILSHQDLLREQPPAAEPAAGGARRWAGQALRGLEKAASLGYLTLPALYLGALAFLKGAPYAVLLFLREPRRRVKRLFLLSLGPLRGLALERRSLESLLEFASRAEESRPGLRLTPWVEAYLEAVFAPHFGPSEYRRAMASRRSFRLSRRASFPLPARLASFLDPRTALRGWRGRS
jgi:transglutaminase-like putative cysteine protease